MSDHIQQAAEHRKGLLITAFGGLALTVDIPLIKLSEGEAWSVVATRGGPDLRRCAADVGRIAAVSHPAVSRSFPARPAFWSPHFMVLRRSAS
jgi:hypothetical protein